MAYQCELCKKKAAPPNLILSQCVPYHLGCPADRFRELEGALADLLDCVSIDNPEAPKNEQTYSLSGFVQGAVEKAEKLIDG